MAGSVPAVTGAYDLLKGQTEAPSTAVRDGLNVASNNEETRMSWETFGQVALLIVIYVVFKSFVNCMHNSYCKKCKKLE